MTRPKKRTELTQAQYNEVKDAFDLLNTEKNSKTLEIKECKKAMRALGFELKREDYKKLRQDDLDYEEDDTKGVVGFDKFLALAIEKIAELDPEEEM